MSITSVKIIPPARKLEAGDVRDAVSGYKSYESEVELDERRKIISPSAYIYTYMYTHIHTRKQGTEKEEVDTHGRNFIGSIQLHDMATQPRKRFRPLPLFPPPSFSFSILSTPTRSSK